MRRRTSWLLLLGLCACSEAGGARLAWRIRFANPQTAARAERVEASIIEGDCTGQSVVFTSNVTRESAAELPPELSHGTYAVRGRAFADDCTQVAEGCTQVTIPAGDSQVEVVLEDAPAQAACSEACAALCGSDGGTSPGGSVGGGDSMGGGDAGAGATGSLDGGGGTGSSPDSCDQLLGPNGHCYKLESKTYSFTAAEAACVEWGGHLVSFNDADEELWVNQQAAALSVGGTPPNFWIGFTDASTEARWVWTDASTTPSDVVSFVDSTGKTKYKTTSNVPYTHWGPSAQTVGNGQPNNKPPKDVVSPEGSDCAASMGTKVSGPDGITPRPEWDDQVCSDLKASVCERP